MTPENIEAIKNALAPVADKIGQGAEYGWEVLVMGQFAEGVATLVFTTFVLVSILGGMYVTKKVANRVAEDEAEAYPLVIWFVGVLVLCLFMAPQIGVWYWEGAVDTFAPEYAALKFLISLGG